MIRPFLKKPKATMPCRLAARMVSGVTGVSSSFQRFAIGGKRRSGVSSRPNLSSMPATMPATPEGGKKTVLPVGIPSMCSQSSSRSPQEAFVKKSGRFFRSSRATFQRANPMRTLWMKSRRCSARVMKVPRKLARQAEADVERAASRAASRARFARGFETLCGRSVRGVGGPWWMIGLSQVASRSAPPASFTQTAPPALTEFPADPGLPVRDPAQSTSTLEKARYMDRSPDGNPTDRSTDEPSGNARPRQRDGFPGRHAK